jgi:membrane fusion protein (multidrug efflux system)
MVEPGVDGHDAPEREEPEHEEPEPPAHDEPELPRRERLRRWRRAHRRTFSAIVVAIVLLAAGGVLVAIHLWRYETTDDAQIDAHISGLSARVAATVQRVFVEDNMEVHAGQLLVELDPRDFQVAVTQAEAQLAQAQAELAGAHPEVPIVRLTTQTQVQTASADVIAAEAALASSERESDAAQAAVRDAAAHREQTGNDLARARYLISQRAITEELLDARLATARSATATWDSARARAHAAGKSVAEARERLRQAESRDRQATRTAPEQVDVQRANIVAREARVKAAQASLERARLDLAYTRVLAPFDGVIGRRGVEPGEHVQPGQELLALVDLAHPWVTANFKETQLRHMQPRQAVRVYVDALRRNYDGEVESMPGASGARFSLLPPENATGNYVKVVQRLPVRIRLFPGQPELERLRPGMSVEPRVRVR